MKNSNKLQRSGFRHGGFGAGSSRGRVVGNRGGVGGNRSGVGGNRSGTGSINSNRGGRMNKNFGNREFSFQDVTKLKQLCTATNEWIQQKSSELLDVLSRSEIKGSDNRQSGMRKMNFDFNPPSKFDKKFNDNFQQNQNFSDSSQVFDYNHQNKSDRDWCNQEERNTSFVSSNMKKQDNNNNKQYFSLMQRLKSILKNQPFSMRNASKVFTYGVKATGATAYLRYNLVSNPKKQHRFILSVQKIIVGIGTAMAEDETKTSGKRNARTDAYLNALNRIKNLSAKELCKGLSDQPELENDFSHKVFIQPDPTRPVSSMVIKETEKMAGHRVNNAMSILRRSVYVNKMTMNKLESVVGNVNKITIVIQNKPVGIGFGSSFTKASIHAAGDALFNNFYRNNPVLLVLDEDDSNRWIHWTKIKYLADEMERIGGHSLITGKNYSNRSLATAMKKLVDTHPWHEINNEIVFSPGMPEDYLRILSSIAKERNLNLEERRNTLGSYYILHRYYDPIKVVKYLEKCGGEKGKYRLVSKAEIPQIQCDHWEPTSQVWSMKKGIFQRNNDKKETSFALSKEKNNFNDNELSNTRDMGFKQMTQSEERDFRQTSRFDEMGFLHRPQYDERGFLQGFQSGQRGFEQIPQPNERQFRQMSESDNRGFGPMSQSDNRGFGPMSQSDNRGFGPMSESDNRGFGSMSQLDNRGFGSMSQSDDRGFGPMSQSDDRGFGSMSQSDNRGFGSMSQSDNRGFGSMSQSERGFGPMSDDRTIGLMHESDNSGFRQMQNPDREFRQTRQHDNEEFGQRNWLGNREFNPMHQSDDRDFGQVYRSDDREFRQMSQSNNDNSSQASWHNRREFNQSFWSDKEFNQNPSSQAEDFRDPSRHLETRDFRKMNYSNEHEFNQKYMDRPMSNNFNRETNPDGEKFSQGDRFISMYGNKSEFNSQFNPERNRDQMLSYDECYRPMSDMNKERFGQNPYQNDKFCNPSDIGFQNNFEFDKTSNQDNRYYNQSLFPNNRDNPLPCDDRAFLQGPNYDRRSRPNNPSGMNNQMNQDTLTNPNRMQGNVPWNRMQNSKADATVLAPNIRNNGPDNQPPKNMLRNMSVNPVPNKNQLTELRFLTKKIAHTALHANVKSILANARRLSVIAKARSKVEHPTGQKGISNVAQKYGKGNAAKRLDKRPEGRSKNLPVFPISRNSKAIKKTNVRPFPLKKKSAQQKNTSVLPKGGNTTPKK